MGQIAVAGLFYQYAYLDRNALANNQITVSNNQYFDKFIGGVYQNPYLTGNTLGFAPATEVYMGKSFNILMTDSLWLSNSKTLVDHIEVDAADGLGYRTLTPNTPLPVNYADTGLKIWNFKLFLTNSTVLQSHTRLQVNADVYGQNVPPSTGGGGSLSTMGVVAGPPPPGSTPASAFYYVTSSETYGGIHANGYATVLYAPGHTSIQKPLIVVEGYDPGHYTNPEILTGGYSLRQFNIETANSFTLDNTLHGTLGYDIIFVDYYLGADDIRRNALLVKEVIRWVNSVKTTAEPNVVLGLSMGGIVARYALKKMEDAGENHQTRLFINHDGPQQGANVPFGYQYFVNHARNLYYRAGVGVGLYNFITLFTHTSNNIPSTLNIANEPASRQMLINYIDNGENLDNSVHSAWQTELTNLGYPANCRNVAISNGSECGQTQAIQPGGILFSINGNLKTGIALDGLAMIVLPFAGALTGQPGLLLGVLPGSNTITMNFQMNASAANGGNQAYHGNISYTKKLFWIFNITTTLTDRTRNAPSVQGYDHFGGGLYNVSPILGSSLSVPWFGSYGISFTNPVNFCFVPTPSALDISSNPSNLSQPDYLAAYSEGIPPVAPKATPFANFVTAYNGGPNNEVHISYETRNGNWLADELNGVHPLTSCSAMCLITQISGPDIVCGAPPIGPPTTQTYSVPSVTGLSYLWSVSPNISITSGQGTSTVQVAYNNAANGAGYITLTFTTSCGQLSVTKTLQVGPPDVYYTLQQYTPGQQFCTNSFGNTMSVEPQSANVDYYEWGYIDINGPGPATIVNAAGGPYQDFVFDHAGVFEIYARQGNSCGLGNTVTGSVYVSDNCKGGGFGFNNFMAYPNPAGSSMTITSMGGAAKVNKTGEAQSQSVSFPKQKTPFKYQIFDSKGHILRQGTSAHGDDLNVDVRDIPNNTYYLHIIVGTNSIKKQIIIHH